MKETLPRARIVRRRSTFDLIRAKGRRFNNRWMTLSIFARESEANEAATVAFLTPKRLGPATIRNKLRRRMREIYRRDLMRPEERAYLIWIARPSAAELDFERLRGCMRELHSRLPCSA